MTARPESQTAELPAASSRKAALFASLLTAGYASLHGLLRSVKT